MASKRPKPVPNKPKGRAGTRAPSKVTLSIPADRRDQAEAFFTAEKPQLLSERMLVELITKQKERGLALLRLQERLSTATTMYEADLAELVKNRAIRQLVIVRTELGWELQALPLWRQQFMTLVSLRKETRHYQGLDRLISTITKHGKLPLPPTILIGDSKK